MTKSQKERVSSIILFVVLTLGAILILFPIAWMICTALKSAPEIAMYPPKLLPEKPMFENFIIAWGKAPFTKYTINTLIIVFFSIIGNVFVNSFVSYGFAKVDFAGKNILFTCILATMMIPGFITLVPTYVIFSKLHWVNTYLPLIVPAFLGNAFHIFMMRQFYMTIPIELTEAARIDGAGHFYIWGKLMMPLVKPVMATIALLVRFPGPPALLKRQKYVHPAAGPPGIQRPGLYGVELPDGSVLPVHDPDPDPVLLLPELLHRRHERRRGD